MSKQVRFAEPEEPTHGKKFKHTLDSDEEDDEVNEENYNVLDEDIVEGSEQTTVEFDGVTQITPFNLDEELETGHFDKNGTYIFKKESADDQDNWLSSIDWSKVKEARQAGSGKQPKPKGDYDDTDDDSDDDDDGIGAKERKRNNKIETLYKQIIELVSPGETVQKAIQRYGKNCPRIQRGNKRKQQQNDDANDPEKLKAKENMLKLSTLANDILSTGDMDIYEMTFEQINLQLSKIADSKTAEVKGDEVKIEEDMFA